TRCFVPTRLTLKSPVSMIEISAVQRSRVPSSTYLSIKGANGDQLNHIAMRPPELPVHPGGGTVDVRQPCRLKCARNLWRCFVSCANPNAPMTTPSASGPSTFLQIYS